MLILHTKAITKTTKAMKTRQILPLMLLFVCMMAMGKKEVKKQQLWPDGTPIPEWFSDTSRVDLSNMKRYVVTDYGVDGYSTDVQTEKLQTNPSGLSLSLKKA